MKLIPSNSKSSIHDQLLHVLVIVYIQMQAFQTLYTYTLAEIYTYSLLIQRSRKMQHVSLVPLKAWEAPWISNPKRKQAGRHRSVLYRGSVLSFQQNTSKHCSSSQAHLSLCCGDIQVPGSLSNLDLSICTLTDSADRRWPGVNCQGFTLSKTLSIKAIENARQLKRFLSDVSEHS